MSQYLQPGGRIKSYSPSRLAFMHHQSHHHYRPSEFTVAIPYCTVALQGGPCRSLIAAGSNTTSQYSTAQHWKRQPGTVRYVLYCTSIFMQPLCMRINFHPFHFTCARAHRSLTVRWTTTPCKTPPNWRTRCHATGPPSWRSSLVTLVPRAVENDLRLVHLTSQTRQKPCPFLVR